MALVAGDVFSPQMSGVRDGRVADDTPCHHCGYDLRTLPVNGVCPECATPVRNSLRGNYLAYADPGFLRRIIRGARAVVYSCVLLVVTCLLNTYTGSLYMERCGPITIGLALWGVFLMTSPDPSTIGEAQYARFRWPARGLLILGPVSFVLQWVSFPRELRVLYGPLIFGTCCAGIAGIIYLTRYLKALALRIPAGDLANSLSLLGATITLTIGVLALANAAYYLLPVGRTAPVWGLIFGLPFFVLIGSSIRLAFAIRRLGILVGMSLKLAEQLTGS